MENFTGDASVHERKGYVKIDPRSEGSHRKSTSFASTFLRIAIDSENFGDGSTSFRIPKGRRKSSNFHFVRASSRIPYSRGWKLMPFGYLQIFEIRGVPP